MYSRWLGGKAALKAALSRGRLPGAAAAAALGAAQLQGQSISHAEVKPGAPCCSIETSKSRSHAVPQQKTGTWQWQTPDPREKPNRLALAIPHDPYYAARSEVGSIASRHMKSGSADYSIVLPENFQKDRAEPYPLIISFHPAGRGADHLIDPAGAARTGRDVVAPRDVVWASFDNKPDGGYQVWADGSENWEAFVVEDLIPFVESAYNCGGHQSRRYMTGICMGGIAVLKMAFKYPGHFAAGAAQQPAIPSGVDPKLLPLNDMISGMIPPLPDDPPPPAEHKAKMVSKLGAEKMSGADEKFFREYISPIAMAIDNADEIKKSGIELFLDVGDEDMFNIQQPTELLHRVLWYLRIPHEYHLVRGANHVGSAWRRRGPAAMDFLFRAMDEALNPVEVMSQEDKEWAAWRGAEVNQRSTGTPQPPCPKDDFTAGAGVFSDKAGVFTVEYAQKYHRHLIGSPTDGPEELMGHPWRMPKPQ